MNLNIFERANEIVPKVDNFINDFMKELSEFMRKSEFRTNNMTYAVVSGLNERNEYNIAKQQGMDNTMYISAKELPEGIDYGTMLRYKNGKFRIDEELTKTSMEELREAIEYRNNTLAQYKTEGVEYLVKRKYEDQVELVNQETGLWFTTNDFFKETLEQIEVGTILECKDNEYVIKK